MKIFTATFLKRALAVLIVLTFGVGRVSREQSTKEETSMETKELGGFAGAN